MASSSIGGAFGERRCVQYLHDRSPARCPADGSAGLGPLPEVKTLVYLGSGLRLNGTENQAQVRATVNAAVRSNVTINPIDTRGLVASAPLGDATRRSPGGIAMFSGLLAQAATTRQQQAQDTLYALAKDTGGRAMFDYNDLAVGIEQAARAVTGYYMIGYYSRNTATDGRYRRVKVSLAAGLSADLSCRPGYYADRISASSSRRRSGSSPTRCARGSDHRIRWRWGELFPGEPGGILRAGLGEVPGSSDAPAAAWHDSADIDLIEGQGQYGVTIGMRGTGSSCARRGDGTTGREPADSI